MARSGVNGMSAGGTVRSCTISEGVGGVVNQLLIQLHLTGSTRLRTWLTDRVNLFLPAHRQLQRPGYHRGQRAADRLRRIAPTTWTPRCCVPAGSTCASCSSRRPMGSAGAGGPRPGHGRRPNGSSTRTPPSARCRSRPSRRGTRPRCWSSMFGRRSGQRTAARRTRDQPGRTWNEHGSPKRWAWATVAYTAHEQRHRDARVGSRHHHLVAPHRRLDVLSIVKRKDALADATQSPAPAHRDDPDRLRRSGGRGSVLRRGVHRTRQRPGPTPPPSGRR